METKAKDGMAMNVDVRTILKCDRCGFRLNRKFILGDYVFKDTDTICNRCKKGRMAIEEIWTPAKRITQKEEEFYQKWR